MRQVKTKTTIGVIGLGYVGLPLSLLAAQKGYRVKGIDRDQAKVQMINRGESPIPDKTLLKQFGQVHLTASTEFSSLSDCQIVIVCVPTPVFKNKLPDYRPLKQACRSLAPHLQPGSLVIVESTINPGVCEQVVLPILVKYSRLSPSQILLAHCPERINPGDKVWQVSNIPRVVGGLNSKSTQRALKFYRSIISARILPMKSIQEAEAVKVVENSFRNINIAFVNELAQSFSRLGIDVVNVINGAATKPFAFMPHFPGCGVGGHCIPVDPYYLIDYAKKNGYSHKFLSLACKINEDMPGYTADIVKRELVRAGKKVKRSQVAVLGLSYKADVDDTRESPAFRVINHLKKSGLTVKYFDPHVPYKSNVNSLPDALHNTDAVLITTAHREFAHLEPEHLLKFGVKILIDGRNCLPARKFTDSGLVYRGIGR